MKLDVISHFRVLGMIPFDDLSGLMLHSIALINPSHFEGWSTSVEESKSLGKRILLSDIRVHREQAPARGVFFPADDAEGLAVALRKTLLEFDPQLEAKGEIEARADFPRRLTKFAQTFQRIVLSARRSRE